MILTLHSKQPEITDIYSFFFTPPSGFKWQAGQFLLYTLPHQNADIKGEQRYFTISSAPTEGLVRLTTRISLVHSSFKEALLTLPIGSTITASEPEGEFVYDEPEATIVMLAGGIGITPFRSMLHEQDASGKAIKGTLFYLGRDEHFLFAEELNQLVAKHPQFSITYLVNPVTINQEVISQAAPNPADSLYYISGPEPMVEVFSKHLGEYGIGEGQMRLDYFPGYDWPIV